MGDLRDDLKELDEKFSESFKKEQELSKIVSSMQEEQQHYTKKDQQNQLVITNLKKDNKLLDESKAAIEKELLCTRDELQKENMELRQKYDKQKVQYEENAACLQEK